MHANMDGNDLLRARGASGLIAGQPIKPPEGSVLHVPPLKRPSLEVLVEELHLKDAHGGVTEEAFRASPNERDLKIGEVTVQLVGGLSSVGSTRDEAVHKLCRLIGQAVAQAYVDLMGSEDEEKTEAARTMEVG